MLTWNERLPYACLSPKTAERRELDAECRIISKWEGTLDPRDCLGDQRHCNLQRTQSPQAYRLHPRAGRRTMVVLSKIILSPEGGSGQRQRGARHLADRPQQAARKQEAGLDMGRRR